MTEEIKIDEEFQYKALFDLEFEEKEARYADSNRKSAERSKESAAYYERKGLKNSEWGDKFSLETEALKNVEYSLGIIQDPKLKEQATLYLDNLINKDDNDLFQEQLNNKDKGVDLDGSKKSLWGKLKNKAKNFWYSNNVKKVLESRIEALKEDMIKNPQIYNHLRSSAKGRDLNKKVSFNDVVQARNRTAQFYKESRIESMCEKEFNRKSAERSQKFAQKHEATIEAIHQVRDNAAKEIEQRATARDTTGIKDAQANTGVDKLADKAKAMEGMTPQERLAFRMSQLRGTSKEEPAKPVAPRTVDSNVMNKAMEGKMRA